MRADGLAAAGEPEAGAVEAEGVDVVADADRAEAVGAVGRRLEVGGGPADAAVGPHALHLLDEVDLDLEVPLFVEGLALLHADHSVGAHAFTESKQ